MYEVRENEEGTRRTIQTDEGEVVLELIREIDGHKFWKFRNDFAQPADRFLGLQHSAMVHDIFSLTPEVAKDILDAQMKALMAGNTQEVGKINMLLTQAIEIGTTMEALMDLATDYYVLDDERIDQFQEQPQITKKTLWRKYPEERNFCLAALLKDLGSYQTTSEAATALYSMTNNPQHRLLDFFVSQMRTGNSSGSSIKTASTSPRTPASQPSK